MKLFLLLIPVIFTPFVTAEDETSNCIVYGSTNVCFNRTSIKISKTTGNIKKTDFPPMPSITQMVFMSNNLTEIEPEFFSLFPNLNELTISGNDKFPIVTRQLLKHCRNLSTLKIYFNLQLHHIDENVIRNFPKLRELTIRSERIQRLKKHDFEIATELRVLRIDLTTVKRIDSNAFEPIGKLEELSLMANNYLKINAEIFNFVPNLKELNLIYAEIDDIRFLKKLVKLQTVRLAGNRISGLKAEDVEGLNDLKELDLAHTRIKHIDTSATFFNNVPKLEKLDLTCHDLKAELYDIEKFYQHGVTIIDKYAGDESRLLSC